MFRLECDIIINESPEVVWAFVANLPMSLTCHQPRLRFHWIGNVKIDVGGRYLLDYRLPVITLRKEGRITLWDPPTALTMALWNQSHPRRGFARQQRFKIKTVEGQSNATVLQIAITGSRSPWFFEMLYKEIVRRSVQNHLEALKRVIESTEKSGRIQRDSAHQLAGIPAASSG